MPLGEDAEAYRIDILADDGRILRSLASTAPSALYAAADEAADFGALRTEIDFAVGQLGARTGPGPARRARVSLRRA